MKRTRTLLLSALAITLPACWGTFKEMDFHNGPSEDGEESTESSSLWGDTDESAGGTAGSESSVDGGAEGPATVRTPPLLRGSALDDEPSSVGDPSIVDDPSSGDALPPAIIHVLLTDAPGEFEAVPVTIAAVEAFLAEPAVAPSEPEESPSADGGVELPGAAEPDTDGGFFEGIGGFGGTGGFGGAPDGGAFPDFDMPSADGGALDVPSDSPSAGWVTLVDQVQSYDLLELQNGVTAALGNAEVPAGRYTQIRLIVDSASVVVGGQTHDLAIPSGESTGLKLNYDFDMSSSGAYEIVLDFDAQASIKKAGPKYLLTPVVMVQSFGEAAAD